MEINLIVAMDKNGLIGIGNKIPWRISDDLKYFKNVTSGYPVIMGRKTYESIGRPLPKRTNIILSLNPDFNPEGCIVDNDLKSAIGIAEATGAKKCFIIGGGEIYKLAIDMDIIDRMYITSVETFIKLNEEEKQNAVYFKQPNNFNGWGMKFNDSIRQSEKNEFNANCYIFTNPKYMT